MEKPIDERIAELNGGEDDLSVELLKKELEEKVAKMSPQEKLSLKAKIQGYRDVPVGIDEFIESDLYLGGATRNGRIIYPFWRKFLREVYPDPLTTTHQIVILTGGIGIGKSTVSNIMALYTLYKILMLQSTEYFDIELIKGVNLVFFHVLVEKAETDFIEPIKDNYIKKSPWFQKNLSNQKWVTIAEGPNRNKGIGGDVVFYNLSEINFIDHDKAVEKINSAISRFYSRWRSAIGSFGHVVLDSSVFGDASVVEEVISTSSYDIKVVRAPIWEVKAHTNQFSKTTFKVFGGDATNPPFIVTADTPTKGLDPDKFVDVPENLLPEYKTDIYKALQETAGVSTTMSGKYFADYMKLNESFNLPQVIPDVIVLDYFGNDQIWDYVGKLFDTQYPIIPRDKKLAIRFDVAYASDLAGVAVGYVSDIKVINEAIGLTEPIIDAPLIFGVGRKAGQETCISKLKQFVYDLAKFYDIGVITTDSFQSKNMQQDLERDGFNCYFMSMDRNNQAYDLAKTFIYEGRFNQMKNELHIRDMLNLRIIDGKVDHLPIYSKDTCDASCGLPKSIMDNYEAFKELSQKYVMEKTADLYKDLYKRDGDLERLKQIINRW